MMGSPARVFLFLTYYSFYLDVPILVNGFLVPAKRTTARTRRGEEWTKRTWRIQHQQIEESSLLFQPTIIGALFSTKFDDLESESTLLPSDGDRLVSPSNSTTTTTTNFEEIDDAPSVGKILRFAIPAIGVWLCGPLLSLIDTSAVGLLSGTGQQAALNPAVTVTEYTALCKYFAPKQ